MASEGPSLDRDMQGPHCDLAEEMRKRLGGNICSEILHLRGSSY